MPEDTPFTGTTDPGDSLDWDAIARYLAGESSAEESERIRALLASRPADEAVVTALDRVMSKMPTSIAGDIDVEAALERVRSRRDIEKVRPIASAPSRRPARWRFLAPLISAAAAVLIVVTGWLALREKPPAPPTAVPHRGYATGIGTRDSIHLADGSLMVLGPASFASIATDFGTKQRRIDIRGDVYFDVVHKREVPFVVHAGAAVVQDVGTRFTVRSDAGDAVIVAVAEGAVSLSINDSTSPHLLLQAGQRGAVRPNRPPERLGTGAVNDDLAWMSGQLVFRESPMSEVVSSLRRWYGIALRFEDRAFETRHITATFSGEPPERVIEVLRLALGARIDRRGDTIVVRSPESGRGGTRSR
ncbi:MAG TPA: FecR domain-containing protein [Gemmatimonadaceae bacterium]|jgi:transmembrane sensor